MFLTDRSLMRAQQPAFDQGGNAMNPGHADVGRIASVRDNNPLLSGLELNGINALENIRCFKVVILARKIPRIWRGFQPSFAAGA
jgi:hypothetical protein